MARTRIRLDQIISLDGISTLKKRIEELDAISAPVDSATSLPTTGKSYERRFVKGAGKEYYFNPTTNAWAPVEGGTATVENNTGTTYNYDANGRIVKETITGDISRVTDFVYFADTHSLAGKIEKQIVAENGKTKTSVFSYDSVTGKITGVSTTTV